MEYNVEDKNKQGTLRTQSKVGPPIKVRDMSNKGNAQANDSAANIGKRNMEETSKRDEIKMDDVEIRNLSNGERDNDDKLGKITARENISSKKDD